MKMAHNCTQCIVRRVVVVLVVLVVVLVAATNVVAMFAVSLIRLVSLTSVPGGGGQTNGNCTTERQRHQVTGSSAASSPTVSFQRRGCGHSHVKNGSVETCTAGHEMCGRVDHVKDDSLLVRV